MRVTEVAFDGNPPIEGYGPGFFRVRGAVHHGPLALVSAEPLPWTGVPEIGPFLEHRAAFDVLLLGTGDEIAALPRVFRAGLEEAGIAFEMMATPSACRTYNVLLAEGRRVAAGLMPIRSEAFPPAH